MFLKLNYKKLIVFVVIGLLFTTLCKLIEYYIPGLNTLFLPLIYLFVFLLGMLFRLPNLFFIPYTYLLILGSDFAYRQISNPDELGDEILFSFFIFYTAELIILTLIKIRMDAKDQNHLRKETIRKVVFALIMFAAAFGGYSIFIRQVFIFY